MKLIRCAIILCSSMSISLNAFSDRGGAPVSSIYGGSNASPYEFRYSYKTNTRFPLEIIPDINFAQMAAGIPFIGHYQNAGTKKSGLTVGGYYNFMQRLATIENRPEMLINSMPSSLSKVLLTQLGIKNIPQLLTMLQQGTIHVDFYTIIWGQLASPKESPNAVQLKTATDKTSQQINKQIQAQRDSFNIAYHPVLSNWLRKPTIAANDGFPLKEFKAAIPMGIFGLNGIQGLSMAANSLTPTNVHFHNAFSPNNARFRIDPQNAAASFWSAAIAPNNKAAVITFNIMLYQDHGVAQVDDQARRIAQTIENLVRTNPYAKPDELIQLLQRFATSPKIDAYNQQTLQQIIKTLQSIHPLDIQATLQELARLSSIDPDNHLALLDAISLLTPLRIEAGTDPKIKPYIDQYTQEIQHRIDRLKAKDPALATALQL